MSFKTFLRRLKVTLEGHINEFFWAITPTYMHEISKKNCTGVLLEEEKCQFETFVHARTLTLPLPLPPPL